MFVHANVLQCYGAELCLIYKIYAPKRYFNCVIVLTTYKRQQHFRIYQAYTLESHLKYFVLYSKNLKKQKVRDLDFF